MGERMKKTVMMKIYQIYKHDACLGRGGYQIKVITEQRLPASKWHMMKFVLFTILFLLYNEHCILFIYSHIHFQLIELFLHQLFSFIILLCLLEMNVDSIMHVVVYVICLVLFLSND